MAVTHLFIIWGKFSASQPFIKGQVVLAAKGGEISFIGQRAGNFSTLGVDKPIAVSGVIRLDIAGRHLGLLGGDKILVIGVRYDDAGNGLLAVFGVDDVGGTGIFLDQRIIAANRFSRRIVGRKQAEKCEADGQQEHNRKAASEYLKKQFHKQAKSFQIVSLKLMLLIKLQKVIQNLLQFGGVAAAGQALQQILDIQIEHHRIGC